ncbi:MAG TPA: PH domain-containing protein [Acidothermaceae bacterium]
MTAPGEHAPPLDQGGRPRGGRLHPLTPIVRASRVLVSLAAIGTYNLEKIRHAGWWLPVIVVGVLIVGLAASALSWAFTRFAIEGGEVHIDSGVLFRRSRQVRIDRLQAIDIVQPLLARAFGLAELKLDMAGGSEGRVRLGYLRLDEAQALRAALLAMAAGLDHRTPEAPQRPLVHCTGAQIVGSALLSTPALIGFVWVAAFLAGAIASRHPGVFTGALAGVISVFSAVWQTIQQHFGFTVADSPDGLRLRHGLFETRAQTVPPGRVQAVRIVQPLMWRLFGWVRVDANIAGYAGHRADDGRQRNSVLLPVGSREQALLVISRALPDVDIDAVPMTGVPARAKWRSPLLWWTYRAGADDAVVSVRSGLLTKVHAVMRHEKIQSVRLAVGPWERALRLATVHVDSTKGPVHVVLRHRDLSEGRRIVDAEVLRAERARALRMPDRWMTTNSGPATTR